MPKLKLTKRAVSQIRAPDPSGKQVLYWDSELKGFAVLASGTTNSKTFVVQRTLGTRGKTRRLTVGPTNSLTIEQARDRAADMLNDLRNEIDPKAKTGDMTLKEGLDNYLLGRKDIVALTREVVTSADPDATGIVRDDLTAAVAQFADVSFLDPSITELANVRPAAITFGAPSVASTGTTAAAFEADFKALLALVTTNMLAPFLVMRPKVAVALAALDSNLTRRVTVSGGDVGGIPVLTSANVPTDSNSPALNQIILLDASELFVNEGGVELDASDKATIELQTSATDPVTAATVVTSLWQTGLLAVKVTRFCYWKARRDGAVAVLSSVNY